MKSKLELDRLKAPKKPDVSLDEFLYECERRAVEREKVLANCHSNGNEPERELCECSETRIKGRRFPLHRVPADCEYSQARAALVPEAERRALAIVGLVPLDEERKERDAHGYRFTAAFNREMERLARPLLNGSTLPKPHVEAQSIVPEPVNSVQDDDTQAWPVRVWPS